jgi:hypothetical protein
VTRFHAFPATFRPTLPLARNAGYQLAGRGRDGRRLGVVTGVGTLTVTQAQEAQPCSGLPIESAPVLRSVMALSSSRPWRRLSDFARAEYATELLLGVERRRPAR